MEYIGYPKYLSGYIFLFFVLKEKETHPFHSKRPKQGVDSIRGMGSFILSLQVNSNYFSRLNREPRK